MRRSERKFNSPGEMKEETRPPTEINEKNSWPRKERHSTFHGSHSPRWSEWEANDALKSKDRSGWSSREFSQGNRDMQVDDTTNKGGLKVPTSAFDGPGYQKYIRSPDNSQSLSNRDRERYSKRSRDSRSPKRSRSRDRGRSRSPKQSRDRERGRSRSRSWERGQNTGRSRSPFRDRRRESFVLTDKRSGTGMTSKPCRDFAAGKCRRGSQCRFFHQDNLTYRDGGRSENDLGGWNKPDHGGVSKYGGDNKRSPDSLQAKISDGCGKYYEDKPLRDGRKDPHYGAGSDNYDRGNKKAFYDQDLKRPGNRSGKIPCKYFAVGRCHKDDCRFSHDDPASDLNGRSHDDKQDRNFDDYNKPWDGPTWDEVAGFQDTTKASRLGEDKKKSWNGPPWDDVSGSLDRPKVTRWVDSSVGITKSHDASVAEKQTDDTWDHSLDNERKTQGGPGWHEKAPEADDMWDHSLDNGADSGTTEIKGSEMLTDREEHQNNAQVSELQTSDGMPTHGHQQNIIQETSADQLDNIGLQRKVPENSYIQEHHRQGGDSNVMIDGYNAVNQLQLSGNVTHQVLVPGQNFKVIGKNLGSQPPSSSGTDQCFNEHSLKPSNGLNISLDKSMKHNISTLDPQNLRQNKEAVKISETVEFGVPRITSNLCNNITSEQVAQLSKLAVSLTQISQNGQQIAPLYAPVNPPNTTGMSQALSNSERVVTPVDFLGVTPYPATRLQEQPDLTRDGMEPSKPGNSNNPSGFSFNSVAQENQVPSKMLPLQSTGNTNSSQVHESGMLPEFQESSMLKQQEAIANPEVNVCKETIEKVNRNNDKLDKKKLEKENIDLGSADAHGKIEESNSNQDEKAMRLFKVALVEFVKEILKPTWKQGQMSKEVHKTIVKKVVDKVTSTIQAVQIPKTKEHIDQYLSFSKPKISKLIQAYVEKFQKAS